MKIGLDVMGGDFAPEATISGAIIAQRLMGTDDSIVLIGNPEVIKEELTKQGAPIDLFEIVEAYDVIEMDESPTRAFSSKPDSTMGVGFKLLRKKKIDAFASAGNSGAMLVGAIYSVNTIQGIIRPATAAVLPREDGGVNLLIDVGTNPDVRADVMYQFAILGDALAKCVYNIPDPRVGLLNIGHEDKKGNLLAQSVFQMMKESNDFNFIGNVEGRDVLKNRADVIVCDGFTGNILLKSLESVYRIIIKRGINDDYFNRFNYEQYGGTPILGVNAPVIIGHGISNGEAIKNMILLAHQVAKSDLSGKITQAITNYLDVPNGNSDSN